ncbi:MAG: 3(2),5-bisphosphate nucleotidase [Chthonomonadaceae bacterium]|nr:3(2),5-bisphosphate nucleotidase [Chthonomonadaceae bacterium]
MSLKRELEFAVAAVTKACRLCEAVRAEIDPANVITKGDQSPVTVADYGAQAVVSRELRAAFPDALLVAEEDTGDLCAPERAALRAKVTAHVHRILPDMRETETVAAIAAGDYAGGATGRFWTLDPIDGTKGFLRGGQYAVALALIEDGQVILGVLGCPRLPYVATAPDTTRGCLFVAVRGEGARQSKLGGATETSIRVNEIDDPAQAAFCESVEAGHSSHDESAQIAANLGVVALPVRMDSQCKYAAVARGDAAIYLRLPTRADYQEKIWDHAAGLLVIEEAGGKVTDTRGQALDFSHGRTLATNVGVVATNGKLHARVLEAVSAVLA